MIANQYNDKKQMITQQHQWGPDLHCKHENYMHYFPPLHRPTIFDLLQQIIIKNEKLMAKLSLFVDGVILLVC
jgi:hypothetical protein